MNTDVGTKLSEDLFAIGREAKAAARVLALAPAEQKNRALRAVAAALGAQTAIILETNALDRKAAGFAGRPGSFVDRLTLNEGRVEAMARGLEEIAALPDPVGAVIAAWERPNGF